MGYIQRQMHGPELCIVTEGEVTITAAESMVRSTFKAGDVFILPRGFTHDWSQGGAVSKFYAESPACADVDTSARGWSTVGAAGSSTTPAVIACDKMAECKCVCCYAAVPDTRSEAQTHVLVSAVLRSCSVVHALMRSRVYQRAGACSPRTPGTL